MIPSCLEAPTAALAWSWADSAGPTATHLQEGAPGPRHPRGPLLPTPWWLSRLTYIIEHSPCCSPDFPCSETQAWSEVGGVCFLCCYLPLSYTELAKTSTTLWLWGATRVLQPWRWPTEETYLLYASHNSPQAQGYAGVLDCCLPPEIRI